MDHLAMTSGDAWSDAKFGAAEIRKPNRISGGAPE
jgi:hypothetical protein